MYSSTTRKTIAAKVRAITMLLLLLVVVTQAASAGQIKGCNSNGTYTATSLTQFCTDPDSGLRVNYIIYIGFTWTTNGVAHSFPIGTDRNSSNGYGPDGGVLCGPDDVSTGSAYASDGSGFFMSVGDYFEATIYDPNGNIVFQFGHGTFCS